MIRPIHPLTATDAARFWQKVEKADGCWNWLGAKQAKDGRGRFVVRGINRIAPRVAWAIVHGRDPDGFVCHSCDNPRCVNPAHLWVGSNRDNVLDAASKGRLWQQRVTRCPRGHEYTPDNTIIGGRGRACRECQRVYGRERKRRIREAWLAVGLNTKGRPYARHSN